MKIAFGIAAIMFGLFISLGASAFSLPNDGSSAQCPPSEAKPLLTVYCPGLLPYDATFVTVATGGKSTVTRWDGTVVQVNLKGCTIR